jgi:hypothetical protein
MNSLYKDIVVERIKFALACAAKVSTLEHCGVKGSIREILIAELFRPLLPLDVGIATGILISFDDRQSAQQDIVIFDRSILPPVMFEGGVALIPIEAALATIEVKSCLSASELRDIYKNGITVRELTIQTADPGQIESTIPIGVLFALDTDLKAEGKTEAERYEEILGGEPPPLSAICVAGRGCWFNQTEFLFDKESRQFRTRTGQRFEYRWREILASNEHDEILELLAILHSKMRDVGSSRGRPPLYNYLR